MDPVFLFHFQEAGQRKMLIIAEEVGLKIENRKQPDHSGENEVHSGTIFRSIFFGSFDRERIKGRENGDFHPGLVIYPL
jgi:hypothetical protein